MVVVDTGVFSATLVPQAHPLKQAYAADLEGRRLVISFQTVAELRYGAKRSSWGTRHLEELEQRIRVALTLPPHDALATAWADLRNACRQNGHAFQAKAHSGDLWIAATARLLDAPLVTHDKSFEGSPGLSVTCRA